MACHNIELNNAYTSFKYNYATRCSLLKQLCAAFANIDAALKIAWDNNNKLYHCIDTLEKQLNYDLPKIISNHLNVYHVNKGTIIEIQKVLKLVY